MHNSVYKLIKQLKQASAMDSGSFLPPEPLPNSVKAKQIEQQELAAEQGEAAAGAGNDQLMQMQKAQEDAVGQLQQTQEQLNQAQAELQNVQMQAQQQQHETQMMAQQEIQKAKMDAQYELQAEKIKNQQKLLAMQEKNIRTAGKAKPDQNHILSTQLKRVVKKVNSLNKAASTTPPPVTPAVISAPRDSVSQRRDTDILSAEKKFQGLPHSGVLPSQRTQQQWNEISDWKKNRLATNPVVKQIQNQTPSVSTPSVGNVASSWGNAFSDYVNNPWAETDNAKDYAFGEYNLRQNPLGSALRFGTDFFTSYVPNMVGGLSETTKGVYNLDPTRAAKGLGTTALGVGEGMLTYAKGLKGVGGFAKTYMGHLGMGFTEGALGLGDPNEYKEDNTGTTDYQDAGDYLGGSPQAPGGVPYPGGFSAPQPQQRWDSGLSPSERFSIMNQSMMQPKMATAAPEPEYPDIRKFMKNPPPEGEYIPSPIPTLQSGFKMHKFNMPQARQQGYGPLGDFIKQLIFQVGMPMFGMRNPMQPDFAKVYGSLVNNQAYKLRTPSSL